MGAGGGGGGGPFVTFNPRSTGITTVLYYLNLWIYHRSLLVALIVLRMFVVTGQGNIILPVSMHAFDLRKPCLPWKPWYV